MGSLDQTSLLTVVDAQGNNKEVRFSGFAELCRGDDWDCRPGSVLPRAVELRSKEGYSAWV